jgi:apolipoprotein D and lipocalin family protein
MVITTVKSRPLQTVPHVDLKKYAGKWYEIAAFPQRFQKGCICTTAEYTLTDRGFVIVENRCIRTDKHNEESYIRGRAFVEQNSGNAKLKVQFYWPFKGKYWIIDLALDYSYAVVSHPDKKHLWILCRQPRMNESLYQSITGRLEQQGFDISKLKKTAQHCSQ